MYRFISIIALLVGVYPLFSQSAQDEQSIRDLIQTMADGWSEGNGEKFATAFAEVHDYVVWNGYYMREMKKPQNQAAHQQLFNTVYRNTDMHMVVDKIKFIRPDVALIHVFAAVSPNGEARPKDPEVLFSALATKESGKWQVVAFHNLDLEVFQDEQTRNNAPMPPMVMYASWYAGSNN